MIITIFFHITAVTDSGGARQN